MKLTLCAASLAMMAVAPAFAASDDAWAQFRADVEAACLAAAEPMFGTAAARVDPFGSENYGLALITGTPKGIEGEIAAICVYDKKTKAAEIGGELPPSR